MQPVTKSNVKSIIRDLPIEECRQPYTLWQSLSPQGHFERHLNP